MKVYKPLVRWWDSRFGGEFRYHADFTVEAGERMSEALRKLFEPQEYDYSPHVRKVHLMMSVYEEKAD